MKRLNCYVLMLIALLMVFLVPSSVKAKTFVSKNKVDIQAGSKYAFDVYSSKPSGFLIEIGTEMSRYTSVGGLRVELIGDDGIKQQNDLLTFRNSVRQKEIYESFFNDNKIISAGKYHYVLSNESNVPISVDYSVYNYTKIARKLKVPKKVTVRTNDTDSKLINIEGIPSGSLIESEIKKIKSSNSKIAYMVGTESQNSYWIQGGKKAGKCFITIKMKNGKKYKIQVTVKPQKPYIKWYKYELESGKSFQNKVVHANGKVKWWSTNTHVAKVSKQGRVYGVGVGKCYVKGRIGKKTYKCKVIVNRSWPDFSAEIVDWSNSSHYIKVRFENDGEQSLFVPRDKGRNLIKISSGAVRTITYHSRSIKSVPGAEVNHIFNYQFKYGGIIYNAKCYEDAEESEYSIGSSTYYTYMDE